MEGYEKSLVVSVGCGVEVVVQNEPGGCDGVEQRLGIIAAVMAVCFRNNGRAQLGDGQRLQDRFNNPAQAEQKHPS
eukprot:488787-Pleurochrysis_carterae.AAC.1